MQKPSRNWVPSWLKKPPSLGTDGNADPIHARIIRVLDRRDPFNALAELSAALNRNAALPNLSSTALAFDANVILRLGGHRKRADIIDYLSLRHEAPIILPGQVIQEFWNNHSKVNDTVAVAIKKHFENLKREIAKIDNSFSEYAEEIQGILDRFLSDHGYKLDPGAVERTLDLFNILSNKAHVAYAPRALYANVAAQRQLCKTPPGFRDDGDGDFYVWVDMLTALDSAKRRGVSFDRVVLVSLDQKIDWSREGVAHPILVAEVLSLLGCSFEIWTPDKLAEHVLAEA